MGFGMSGIDDWLDLMPDTVTVAPWQARDTVGVAQYGPPVPYRARVNNKSQMVRVASGELVAARGVAWLATTDDIDVRSKITLPDGSTPVILVSNVTPDENGPLFVKVGFG
jgi:hypothetical protein